MSRVVYSRKERVQKQGDIPGPPLALIGLESWSLWGREEALSGRLHDFENSNNTCNRYTQEGTNTVC